jgi:hypothetical protein
MSRPKQVLRSTRLRICGFYSRSVQPRGMHERCELHTAVKAGKDWKPEIARLGCPLLMLWTAPPPAHECQGCGCC